MRSSISAARGVTEEAVGEQAQLDVVADRGTTEHRRPAQTNGHSAIERVGSMLTRGGQDEIAAGEGLGEFDGVSDRGVPWLPSAPPVG